MLGAIAGDTIGSVYEFNNTKSYNFRLFTPESSYTDDSIMTFAVARWLMTDNTHDPDNLISIMTMYGRDFPHPMGGYGERFANWLFTSGPRKPYGSWGNGSAMRVSPIGWWFETLEETEHAAEVSASVTHNHPEGIKGAKATAAAIFLARTGKSKDEIKAYIEETFGYDLQKSWQDWQNIYCWDESCQGTVPQALIAFLESTDFEDAIRKAVSLGGDSDTLACITGGVAEAFYGELPEEIRTDVRKRLAGRLVDELDSFYSRIAETK